MNCRVVDLRHKEVINKSDGARLGFIDDVEVDTKTARVVAIVLYGRLKCCGILGRCEDTVIAWENIELIGEDTVIVNFKCDNKRKKGGLPFIKQ